MKREQKISQFGFFNVDKPSGIVSSTVVNKIKWLSGVPCGHMGTLDPLASGVLPVGVGNAARLFDYFLEKEKEYIAEFWISVCPFWWIVIEHYDKHPYENIYDAC
jgi:tRNA pseudouridine(55) synthase